MTPPSMTNDSFRLRSLMVSIKTFESKDGENLWLWVSEAEMAMASTMMLLPNLINKTDFFLYAHMCYEPFFTKFHHLRKYRTFIIIMCNVNFAQFYETRLMNSLSSLMTRLNRSFTFYKFVLHVQNTAFCSV
ncbi:hypothetical protein Plhal710r2_c015g0066181 [Plasmopara halstedii]